MPLHPMYDRYTCSLGIMTLEELRAELYRLEHPTTTNCITLAVLETKADIVREKIAECERDATLASSATPEHSAEAA